MRGPVQMPVIASNRVGTEEFPERPEKTASSITFHGGSFITGPTGEIVAQARSPMRMATCILARATSPTAWSKMAVLSTSSYSSRLAGQHLDLSLRISPRRSQAW